MQRAVRLHLVPQQLRLRSDMRSDMHLGMLLDLRSGMHLGMRSDMRSGMRLDMVFV